MLIHIGGDTFVNLQQVIGIFNVHAHESSNIKFFIDQSVKKKAAEYVEPGEVKSCIVTDEKIYFSSISSATLKKRAITMGLQEKFEID